MKKVCRSLCVALMSSWCVKTCSCTRMPHGGFLLRGCSIPRQLAYRMRRQLCRSANLVSPTGGSVSRLCLRYGRLKKMRCENESAARSPRMICRTLRPMSTRCSVVNTSASSSVNEYHGSVSRIASPVHDRKYATMKRSSCRYTSSSEFDESSSCFTVVSSFASHLESSILSKSAPVTMDCAYVCSANICFVTVRVTGASENPPCTRCAAGCSGCRGA